MERRIVDRPLPVTDRLVPVTDRPLAEGLAQALAKGWRPGVGREAKDAEEWKDARGSRP